MDSPYSGLLVEQWENRTIELVSNHPLNTNEMYEVVLHVWNDILDSGFGSKPYRIGQDLFPRPQIMAYFLHELIPLEFANRYPGIWRREEMSEEKDLVFISRPEYSIEIKTSSSSNSIFGNRSYAQVTERPKKTKSGYYLAINFEKFLPGRSNPQIKLIRFGWLDHSDWIGQNASTGQQARLIPDAERYKLLKLPLE